MANTELRQRKPGQTAIGGTDNSLFKTRTTNENAPGFLISPSTITIACLIFMAVVILLHIFAKLRR
ncbi:hypothetical protein J8273_4326 [Carpediemonas membranifera]|uniref:Protein transport protein Sec61 subunit beta n=1 Tax=Carpediemonas membranifera TaxID=201153 RepID=A0A8J6DZW6_9EUKA|nr:hypothetical protein J8273_4326 [Carpediemonas membranifera]|eukprot:KAG9394224.1 hypothetical protein J8273_4326 [Carpediemonas membranifera]